jgi:hypothetical protein
MGVRGRQKKGDWYIFIRHVGDRTAQLPVTRQRLAEAAGRILECLAVSEKAGTVEDGDLDLLTEELHRHTQTKAAKRRVFPGVRGGITAANTAGITAGVTHRDSNDVGFAVQQRQFPVTAARSGQCRCRAPKTRCAGSHAVGFFPVLPPVLPPGDSNDAFSRWSAASISPESGFPRRFR